jgi:hypothetical protein
MRQLLLLLVVIASLSSLNLGCGGEKRPKADPNFKPTTNPSDIVVPPQMKKTLPPAGK